VCLDGCVVVVLEGELGCDARLDDLQVQLDFDDVRPLLPVKRWLHGRLSVKVILGQVLLPGSQPHTVEGKA